MKSSEIRKKFFDYFINRGHTQVASSSLIPAEDPTLLFANAGMNQFKDLFLGKEQRSYKRAVSIQKCIRAGGKHNDLENVGFTKRHLTFFEMMGNFSFGDYFKKEAITYAWEFLTQEVKLPADKLYASVYKFDDDSYDIWHKHIGLPQHRIVRLGEADNFWQMGDVGPCGPCTEIYIDRGTEMGCKEADCAPGCSCDRFLEIWNNVFMQFNRQVDATGGYVDIPLKQTGVDTGMGLERLCAVVNGNDSVFETDLFMPIIHEIERLSGLSYQTSEGDLKAAFRVLADHLRSSSFAIADGCSPSNDGRGYVLRKIIRRAALFAQKLGNEQIFAQLVPVLVSTMSPFYPELKNRQQLIESVLRSEIEKFVTNLHQGQQILERYFAQEASSKTITGEQAFKLYDTYGFPLELTNVIAHHKGFAVDQAGFAREMEKQRLQSGKKMASQDKTLDLGDLSTEFIGYTALDVQSPIEAIICRGSLVEELPAGEQGFIITKQTPFYVECGGQISDKGSIFFDSKSTPVLSVKKIDQAIAHEVKSDAILRVGQKISLEVDKNHRINTMKNHTATHLLQAALLKVLGNTVKQAGSLVTPDYLRFDFTYHEALTSEQIKQVEDNVNSYIMQNIKTVISETTYKDAVSRGVIAFFGDKYNPEKVRVVEVPGISSELCGGTHVNATGDIGCFKITEVTALSAGNRRLVALTGPKAIELYQQVFSIIKNAAQDFKVKIEDVPQALHKQKDELKSLQQQVSQFKKQIATQKTAEWLAQATEKNGMYSGMFETNDLSIEDARDVLTNLNKKKPGVYALIIKNDNRYSYAIQIADHYKTSIDLVKLKESLKAQGIQGGGSPTMLQGSFDAALFSQFKKIITF